MRSLLAAILNDDRATVKELLKTDRGLATRVIEEFLLFGLNPTLKDGRGKSVLDWAKSKWIQDLLLSRIDEPRIASGGRR